MGNAKDNSGVWGHSSAIGAENYFIFAVTGGCIAEKAFMGWAAAQSIGLKPLLGSYKGQTEQSFIVNARWLGAILAGEWLKGQESILWLGKCDSRDRREAELRYLTKNGDDIMPRADKLGVLQSCDRETALAQDAWSYDPSTGDYFITIDPATIKLCPIGLDAAMKEHFAQHERPLGENQDTAALIRAYLAARRSIFGN